MAEYRLLIKPSSAKELEAIGTKRVRQRLVSRIRSLASEPRPAGCEELAGSAALLRIRQNQYRVIYLVDDARRVVDVIKVGHRGEVYRGTP